MRNIKLTIEYDGTDFNGWQVQEKTQRTVQGEIEKVLERIFKQPLRILGSGRTDSGVHAIGQVANFKVETDRTLSEIRSALNANLPKDIAILKVEEVPIQFHSQYSAKNKTYRYTILNKEVRSPQRRHNAYFYPHKLNLALVRKEAKALTGKKDFKSFTTSESARLRSGKSRGTIRTVRKLLIKKSGDIILIDIEADGFLYKMVRNIVGTLLEIGSGRLPSGSMRKIIRKQDRNAGGKTAPAWGLCLLKVDYGKEHK